MQYTDDASKKQRRVDRLMGHWLPEENACYLAFLECSEQSFQAKGLRRRDKVFKAMAKTIRTRDPEQCRSHHQKMEKKYKSFEGLLAALREEHRNAVQKAVDADATSPQSKDDTTETDSHDQPRSELAHAIFMRGQQQFLRGVESLQIGEMADPEPQNCLEIMHMGDWQDDIFGMLNL